MPQGVQRSTPCFILVRCEPAWCSAGGGSWYGGTLRPKPPRFRVDLPRAEVGGQPPRVGALAWQSLARRRVRIAPPPPERRSRNSEACRNVSGRERPLATPSRLGEAPFRADPLRPRHIRIVCHVGLLHGRLDGWYYAVAETPEGRSHPIGLLPGTLAVPPQRGPRHWGTTRGASC